MKLRQLGSVLAANQQFVAFVVAVALVLGVFPGSPGRVFVSRLVDQPATAAPPTLEAPPPPVSEPQVPPLSTTGLPTATSPPSGPEASTEPAPPAELPPPAPIEPVAPCPTDPAGVLLGDVGAGLGDLLAMPIQTEALEDLVELANGCGEHDPTSVVLNLALELAAYVPDLGLPPTDLPNLPPLLPDLSPLGALVELLGPVSDSIREGCAQLALVSLLFVAVPPAFHLPISSGDLIQFLGPATTLCALFDAAPPS